MNQERKFTLELTATQVQQLVDIINNSNMTFAVTKGVFDIIASQVMDQQKTIQAPAESEES